MYISATNPSIHGANPSLLQVNISPTYRRYVASTPEFSSEAEFFSGQLPDTIQDEYGSAFGKSATVPVLTYLKRELMHAIWSVLLDAEFMNAYIHGIVIKCADGITRRIFPRILTYSADYPEKSVISQFHAHLLNFELQSHSRIYKVPWWPPLPMLSHRERPDQCFGDNCR